MVRQLVGCNASQVAKLTPVLLWSLKASPMEQLHIDPMLGIVGVVFAACIQAAFFLYPTRLVSKLVWDPVEEKLLVYNHRLPWVRPNAKPKKFLLGQLILDKESGDVKNVIADYAGNFSLFRGHLSLGPPDRSWMRPPRLLDVARESDIPDPDLFLDLLVYQKPTARLRGEEENNKKGGKRRESKLRKIARRRR
jgi:hypothetical protein